MHSKSIILFWSKTKKKDFQVKFTTDILANFCWSIWRFGHSVFNGFLYEKWVIAPENHMPRATNTIPNGSGDLLFQYFIWFSVHFSCNLYDFGMFAFTRNAWHLMRNKIYCCDKWPCVKEGDYIEIKGIIANADHICIGPRKG